MEDKVREVGELMNHKLHTLASSLIDSDQSQPFDYQTLDIGKQIAQVDPLLLQHIDTLTRSYNETRRRLSEDSLSAHTKRVRKFYCLCVLLFCTNNRCCMPMHVQYRTGKR